MRTIACKTVWALLIGVSLVLSLNSCSKDPVIPEDETKNKLHEDPAKMTVRLVECHLHADWNEIQKAGGPHQNPESPARYMKRVQEITYELKTGSGWTLAEGSQGKFYVQKNGEYKNGNNFTPAPVYLMFIYYYNSKGELMNGQFVENGQENIHQHFFTPENVRPTFDGKPEADDNDPEALVDYLYVDTTPWDKTKHDNEAEITGGTNPVGLKGVIRFLKDRKEFDLKLRLYHGYNSKKNPQTNGFDPFYKPSGVLIQRGTWDINLSIPVVVFWSREEFVDVDPEADVNLIGEDSLDEDSNRTLHPIMKTFNLTWKEALEEIISYTYRGGCGSWIHMALIILRRMEFSLYQSTGGRWGRLFCLVQRKIPSAMLNPRGLLGDVLGHALPSHPVPFFMFGKLKKILYIQDVPFPYRRVWNRLPVFRAIFPLGY